jgi:hypothetical protein
MKLKPGEVICPQCEGFRYKKYHELTSYERARQWLQKCPKCKGAGKLDWVEAVVGKKGTTMKPVFYTREVDFSKRIRNGKIKTG